MWRGGSENRESKDVHDLAKSSVGRRVALHKKSAVAGPRVGLGGCECSDEKTGNLDQNRNREEGRAVVVETIG